MWSSSTGPRPLRHHNDITYWLPTTLRLALLLSSAATYNPAARLAYAHIDVNISTRHAILLLTGRSGSVIWRPTL